MHHLPEYIYCLAVLTAMLKGGALLAMAGLTDLRRHCPLRPAVLLALLMLATALRTGGPA